MALAYTLEVQPQHLVGGASPWGEASVELEAPLVYSLALVQEQPLRIHLPEEHTQPCHS